MAWYAGNARELPWRKTKDPYKIWLSEVILQQTRVRQGLPYYLKFVASYPSVLELAQASEEEVLKLWQGLGYYSRARNLLKAARKVVLECDGVFPSKYKELLRLPGVGDYTASAIASICKAESVAVLDGNVFRVLSRFYGIDLPINSTAGKRRFKQQARAILNSRFPGVHNQAIMEFGALQCKPKNPNCKICPLRDTCVAFQTGQVSKLPVKLKTGKVRNRYFNYLIFATSQKSLLVRKREHAGIWQNLYEFPRIETKRHVSCETLLENSIRTTFGGIDDEIPSRFYEKIVKHQLSHQSLFIKFWIFSLPEKKVLQIAKDHGFMVVAPDEWKRFPVPVVIHRFLADFI